MSSARLPFFGAEPKAAAAPAPDAPGAGPCRYHARVASIGRCEACLAPVCEVCRFTWAGGRHFCPDCATAPRPWVGAVRRRRTGWSLGLAAWNTLGFVVLLGLGRAGRPAGETAATLLGYVMIFLCVLPGAAGFALGLSARSLPPDTPRENTRHSSVGTFLTPPIVWNGVMLGLWFFVMVLGIFQAP